MKFKVGDKVRAIRSSKYSWYRRGNVFTVTECSKLSFSVEGCSRIFDIDNFELVSQCSLPINIAFKNKYEHQAVQQFLFDNGCEWASSGRKILDYGNTTIHVMSGKSICQFTDEDFNASFTINDLETIKEILNPSKPITTFELNDSYRAEIDPNTETVKVGCQTLTFAKVRELGRKLEGK